MVRCLSFQAVPPPQPWPPARLAGAGAIEAWMIRVEENALHPKTGERLQRIHFLSRSHKIGPDGSITWRQAEEGINPDEIMSFVRHRMQPPWQ
jgi:hypothetical protein